MSPNNRSEKSKTKEGTQSTTDRQEITKTFVASGFKYFPWNTWIFFNYKGRYLNWSNFIPNNKEILLLNVAESDLDMVETTSSKAHETLETKMKNVSFAFDIPLTLLEQWMMSLTSLEVPNTLHNISSKNISF